VGFITIEGNPDLRYPETVTLAGRVTRKGSDDTDLTLYDQEQDPHSYSVRLTLGLLGLPYKRCLINPAAGVFGLSASHRFDQPPGRLPVLIDGKLVLRDASVIAPYLARRYDWRDQWLPADDPVHFAETLTWISRIGKVGFRSRGDAEGVTGRPLRLLDNHLRSQARQGIAWFVGVRPGLADIAVFADLAVCGPGAVDETIHPALHEWHGRFRSLRGFTPLSAPIIVEKRAPTRMHPSSAARDRAEQPSKLIAPGMVQEQRNPVGTGE
jgi:glutathione S-transferase